LFIIIPLRAAAADSRHRRRALLLLEHQHTVASTQPIPSRLTLLFCIRPETKLSSPEITIGKLICVASMQPTI
jgi:hypothetical protein